MYLDLLISCNAYRHSWATAESSGRLLLSDKRQKTFSFKGLFLKDSACGKVATIQNRTIFAGPNFAVSYNPTISGTAEIAPVQLIGNSTCDVLRQ